VRDPALPSAYRKHLPLVAVFLALLHGLRSRLFSNAFTLNIMSSCFLTRMAFPPAISSDALFFDPPSSAATAATDSKTQNWKEIKEEDDNMLVKLLRSHLRQELL
jgi:site-specific DNA-adenine methylase